MIYAGESLWKARVDLEKISRERGTGGRTETGPAERKLPRTEPSGKRIYYVILQNISTRGNILISVPFYRNCSTVNLWSYVGNLDIKHSYWLRQNLNSYLLSLRAWFLPWWLLCLFIPNRKFLSSFKCRRLFNNYSSDVIFILNYIRFQFASRTIIVAYDEVRQVFKHYTQIINTKALQASTAKLIFLSCVISLS